MTIRCVCPGCKGTIEIGEDQDGRRLQCGVCQTVFSADDDAIQAGHPAGGIASSEPSPSPPRRPERSRREGPWLPPRRPVETSPLPWILAVLGLFVLLALVVGGAAMFFWMSDERPVRWQQGPQDVVMDLGRGDLPIEAPVDGLFQDQAPLVNQPEDGPVWDNPAPPAAIAWAFPDVEGLENRLQKELLPNNQAGPLGRQSELWDRLKKATEANDWVKSSVLNGRWGTAPFEDVAPGGGLLIGFYCTVENGRLMGYVQPIYLTRDGEKLGKAYGTLTREPYCLKAKAGYAVGAMRVRAGDLFEGMGLTFMRVQGGSLDVNDRYLSPWVGGHGGNTNDIAGDGNLVVGIHGRLVTQGNLIPHGNIATLGTLSWTP